MRTLSVLLPVTLLVAGCAWFREPPLEERSSLEMLAQSLFEEGERAYHAGDYRRAIGIFQTLITSDPGSERSDDCQYLIALSYYQLGEYEEAISASNTLIKEFPETPWLDEAHNVLGQSKSESGDYLGSCYEYLWILDESDNRELKGETRRRFRELVEGELSLEGLSTLLESHRRSEETPFILYEIGRRKLAEGDTEGARENFGRLLAEFPESEYSSQVRSFVEEIPLPKPKMGLILPLTGEYANFGAAVQKGVELAMRDSEVELLVIDSKGDPIDALEGAKRLIQEERVTAILGPVMSMSAIAAAGIANSLGVPLLSPTATEERISAIGPYIFQLNPSIEAQGKTVASFAVTDLSLTKLAALHPDDSYGRDITAAFHKEVVDLGGSVVAVESYKEGTTDFQEQILSIKSQEPEGIFVPGYPEEIVLIAPQLKYHEVLAQIFGSDGWKSEKVITLGEDYVEGAVFSSPGLQRAESWAAQDFVEQFEKRYGTAPSRNSALAYDAAKMILEGISSGATTPLALKEYLVSIVEYWGASGLVSLTGSGGPGGVNLYTIRKGDIVEIR